MKLRPARMIDTPALVSILVERQGDSRYAGLVDVDEPYTRKILAALIQRHGGTNHGSTFVNVAEDDDGEVTAFVAASLDRVYGIGTKLAAVDHFLIGRKGCSPRTLARLFDRYLAWASTNPRVFEIGGSHNDVIEGSDAFGNFYRARDFEECGTIYRRINEPTERRAAA